MMVNVCVRVGVSESGLFKALKSAHSSRGNFALLLQPGRLRRYVAVIALGLALTIRRLHRTDVA